MSARKKLAEFAILIRIHNCLIAFASVLIGSYLAGKEVTASALLGASAVLLICAGGYVINDFYDVETDRINRPSRPLPSGKFSRRTALRACLMCWALGLALSAASGRVALGFATCYTALLWLYSFRLKSAGLAGHILVSAVSSSGFVLGAVMAGDGAAGIPPFGVCFAFHFARELAKGATDIRGDSRAGLRTLPARMGERGSAVLCAAAIAAAQVLSIVPFVAGIYGLPYLVPVLAVQPLLALCIYLIVASSREGTPAVRACGRVAGILKAVMPVGLLAFLLGGM